MPFALLVLRNLLRQKIRTGLTVLGISIGITAVIALGIITSSAMSAVGDLFLAGGSDFAIGRQGTSDLTFSILNQDDIDKVAAYPEVESVTGVLQAWVDVGGNPFFLEIGIDPAALREFKLPLLAGRTLGTDAPDEIMLGEQAAGELAADVGSTVKIRDRSFSVVGIYKTGTSMVDGGAALPIETLRQIERKEGLYSLAYVKARPGVDVPALAKRVEAENPDLATLVGVGDVGKVDQGREMLNALTIGVTVIAIVIGGIAVMNTMVMAVFERTREIGILRAVGWRTRRILQMIVGEALLLSVIAAVLGSIMAVLLTRLITLIPLVRAWLTLMYTPDSFIRGIIVGAGVASLGALYPAFRAARFSPGEAIRYE